MGLDYEVEGPDFKDPYLIHKSLISAFIWLTLNLTLSFSNKWLFQHELFEFPMLIIMTGMFATFLSCSIPIFWLKTVKFVGWDVIKQNWHLILLVAFSHGISTTLENVSIDKTSISFNQIIKATTPVFTMSYGYFFEKRRYYVHVVGATALIACGALFSTYRTPTFDTLGFFCSIGSEILSITRVICTANLLQRAKITPTNLIAIISLPATMSIFPLFYHYEYSRLLHHLHHEELAFKDLSIVVGINWIGVIYTFFTMMLLSYTSAHYFTIIANLKSVSLIVISLYIFQVPLTLMNFFGLILSLSGFCAYTYFRFNGLEEKKDPPLPQQLPPKATRVDSDAEYIYEPPPGPDENRV